MIKICLGWVAVDLASIITKAHCSWDLAHSHSDIQFTHKILDKPGFACVIMCVRKGNHLYFDSKRNNYIVIS
jgi:hypothetical protein